MKHESLDFMDHEIAMEVGHWPDLNLIGHEKYIMAMKST